MKLRPCRLCLLALTVAATAWAQTAPPAAASTPPRNSATKAPARTAGKAAKPGKTGVPDPDLLDGSAFEKEKRPMEGMLSEIEMGEKEGPKGAKISPESGPSGSQSQSPDQNDPTKTAGGGEQSAPQNSEQGGAGSQAEQNQGSQQQGGASSGSPPPSGPAAQAGGTQVSDLKVPEGAQSAGGAQSKSPRDQQIGDASLQIQTLEKGKNDVVGTESSSAQQYEKKLPSGGAQTDNRNKGVEKGRVVPKGL